MRNCVLCQIKLFLKSNCLIDCWDIDKKNINMNNNFFFLTFSPNQTKHEIELSSILVVSNFIFFLGFFMGYFIPLSIKFGF